MPNVSNSRVGTNINSGSGGVRLNQSTTSHSAQVSQARTDVQRLQGSITSPTPDQSNSTQNGASLLEVETGTTLPTTLTRTSSSNLNENLLDGEIPTTVPKYRYIDSLPKVGGLFQAPTLITSDQKNKITELLINNKLEILIGGIPGEQTLASIAGDIAEILGDQLATTNISFSSRGPDGLGFDDMIRVLTYTGTTGRILERFREQQENDSNGAPLPLSLDTLDQMLKFVKDSPGGLLTQEYDPAKKQEFLTSLDASTNNLMTRLQATFNGLSQEDPAALIAELAKYGQAKKVLNGGNVNSPITTPVKPIAPSLTTEQKDPILKLIKNRIAENIMGGGENSNIYRSQSLDGICGEIAEILGDQATTTSYTGISGQIMDKFKDQQEFGPNDAPLGLSTATLKQIYSFVDNFAGGKSTKQPIDTEAIAALQTGLKDMEQRIADVQSGQSGEDIMALKLEQNKLKQVLNLEQHGVSSVNDFQETLANETFSSFKAEFYTNQAKGLDNLLKQWQGIKDDDTGEIRAQVAQIKSQQASTNAAQSFFTSQQDFWTDESTIKYQDKDMAQVQSIYNKIKEVEGKYDSAISNESNREGISSVNKELLGLKAQLTTIRGSETKQPAYKDPSSLKEGVYSQFRVDSLTERDEALQKEQKQLIGKHKGAKGKKNKAQLVEIMNERREIASAKKFWSQQAEFWNKLGDAGFSDKDQDQIDGLTSKLLQLEIDMDQVSSGDATNKTEETEETKKTKKGQASSGNTSAANRAQIKIINTKIAEIKAQITELHTGI